jgi:3-hydroxy-9,10-secoandrosta-1,3,5(10)-triene-9,17-dione monooxygenase
MIRRAEGMCATLRERQAAAEAAGNSSTETNRAMVDAGFYRVILPRRFGGYGFDLPTYVRLVTAVARGRPETAWVLSLVLGHVHQLATVSLDAQRDAYGAIGDFRAPEVAAPPRARRRRAGGLFACVAADVPAHFITGCWS